MYHVCILENLKSRLYIGHTDNLERRLEQHNSPKGHEHLGGSTREATKVMEVPWQSENVASRSAVESRFNRD